MKIGQSLIVFYAAGQNLGPLSPNLVLVKKQLRQESLVLKRLSQSWNGVPGNVGIRCCDYSECVNLAESIGYLDEAFISHRVIIEIELAQLELV